MMPVRMLFLLVAFFVLTLLLVSTKRESFHLGYNSGQSLGTSTTSNVLKERGTHKVKFFDEKTFNEGVDKAKDSAKPFVYHIGGGIVPHHLFAGFIIADFFARLSMQKPTSIILLGPNHYEKGNFKALTSLYSWDTSFGLVNPDDQVINKLTEHNLVKVDEETLPNDQSLSGIMPFVKYYLPSAKVIPILLSGGLTKDESEVLASNLSDVITKDVVVIAPVDFSHYLTSAQAREKDETMIQVLKEFNYRRLYLLNNDYLDSPPSIGVLLMIMQKLGTTKMDLLSHTNSGELQNDEYIQTTSYFSITYH